MQRRLALFLMVWALAAGIFAYRDRESFINPQLYAEDASWLDLLIHDGFADAALHARKDYFVTGNLLLLEAARALHGNHVERVPISIAIVSWIFLGFVAALPLLLFYTTLPPPALGLFAVAMALMPYGAIPSLIIGRLLNAGFFFYVIALWLLLYLRTQPKSYAAQGGIILCLLTNPAAFLLLPLLYPFRKIHWPLIATSGIIALIIATRMLSFGKIGNHLQEPLTLVTLSHYSTHIATMVILLVLGWFVAPRAPFLGIAYGFFVQLIVWIATRPGIFLHGGTEAYFMPLTITALCLAALTCLGLWRERRWLGGLPVIVYVALQLSTIHQERAAMPYLTELPPWQQQLAAAKANPKTAKEQARHLAESTINRRPHRIGGKKWRDGDYLYLEAYPTNEFWYLMWPISR